MDTKKIILVGILAFFAYRFFWLDDGGELDVPVLDQPLTYIRVAPEGASDGDVLPLVILLHGQGDSASHFVETFVKDWRPKARVIAIDAPFAAGMLGRSWGSTPADRDDAITAITYAIPELTKKYGTLGQPTLLGYSIGGGIALAVSSQIPEQLGKVVAVSAFLEENNYPQSRIRGASYPEIVAYHGRSDKLVRFGGITKARDHFDSLGIPITLYDYEDVGHHGIFLEMRADILNEFL